MWTVLSWLLIPILGIKGGVIGASVGYSLVGASSVIAIYIAKKYVNFSISDSMVKPLIGTIVMGTVLVLVRKFLDTSINSMLVLSLVGVLVYGSSMISMMGATLIDDAKKSFKQIFSK
jgi:O-antigen/teichoic acid export membrane protein